MNWFGYWRKKKPKQPPEAIFCSGEYKIRAKLQTDIGCTRLENQDYGVVESTGAARSRGMLIVVADGMGGHKGGEVASRCAVEVLTKSYYEAAGNPESDLRRALEEANSAVFQKSQQSEDLEGMGTTCTALVLLNSNAHCAHVGDSRIYLIRGGTIRLITEDHSAVMQLVREGILTLEEARNHVDRNVITRAVGSRPEIEVYTWDEPLALCAQDRFVVCSDGLYGRVEDSEILEIAGTKSPEEACETLVHLAKQRGGYDNITVAVAYLEPVPLKHP